MKKFISFLLIAALALSMAACSSEENAATTAGTEDTVYTVRVEDQEGQPLAGVMVQLCKDVCMISATDAEGIATFTTAADAYKVSFPALPEGYVLPSEQTEFPFEAGVFEMTLVLKNAA